MKEWFKEAEHVLLVLVIVGVVVGFALGWLVRNFNPSTLAIYLIQFPGVLYLNILQCLVIPIIIVNLMSGELCRT